MRPNDCEHALLLTYYPLVLVPYDCYEPTSAALVIEVAAERDTEICGMVWRFMAETAREGWSVN